MNWEEAGVWGLGRREGVWVLGEVGYRGGCGRPLGKERRVWAASGHVRGPSGLLGTVGE